MELSVKNIDNNFTFTNFNVNSDTSATLKSKESDKNTLNIKKDEPEKNKSDYLNLNEKPRQESTEYQALNQKKFILPQLTKLQFPGLGYDNSFVELPNIVKDKKLSTNINNISTKPILKDLPPLTTSINFKLNEINQNNFDYNYIVKKLNSAYSNSNADNQSTFNAQI